MLYYPFDACRVLWDQSINRIHFGSQYHGAVCPDRRQPQHSCLFNGRKTYWCWPNQGSKKIKYPYYVHRNHHCSHLVCSSRYTNALLFPLVYKESKSAWHHRGNGTPNPNHSIHICDGQRFWRNHQSTRHIVIWSHKYFPQLLLRRFAPCLFHNGLETIFLWRW